MVESTHDGRLPITLLTGFLGAGKTTMLNRLLSDPESGRIAVIVNEFGEIGIDGSLVMRRDEEMMELSNGCICCESKDDLVGALYSLYKKRLGLEKPQVHFDRIVIETTGLADPIPLAQLFFTDMNLSLTFRMDAIVTMVDLKHVIGQIKNSPEAEKQIAISDKIIFNKRDLVSDEQYIEAVERVRALNPLSPSLVTADAVVRPTELLDLGLFNPVEKEAAIDAWLGHIEPDTRNDQHHHGHSHSEHQHDSFHNESGELHHEHKHHHEAHTHGEDCAICRAAQPHLEGVSSLSLYEEKPLAYDDVLRMLAELVDHYGDDLYRVKGLMRFAEQDRPVILQGVQRVFSPLVYAERWPANTPATRLVVIGKGLDHNYVRMKFDQCIAAERPVFDRTIGSI